MSNYDYWNEDYIEHHGILGQKWGTRKYQYEDGSLTPEGKIRYSKGVGTRSTSSSANGSSEYNAERDYNTGNYKGGTRPTVNTSQKSPGGSSEYNAEWDYNTGNYKGGTRPTVNTSQKSPGGSSEYEEEYDRNSKENENVLKEKIPKESTISNAHPWKTRFDWDDATQKTKISVIDKQYSPGKVNVLNEIKKSYGNALNTYVSGLNTIGSWASNLFKK